MTFSERDPTRRAQTNEGKAMMEIKDKSEYPTVQDIPICRFLSSDYGNICNFIIEVVENYGRTTLAKHPHVKHILETWLENARDEVRLVKSSFAKK